MSLMQVDLNVDKRVELQIKNESTQVYYKYAFIIIL